jgi:hypothetical protein
MMMIGGDEEATTTTATSRGRTIGNGRVLKQKRRGRVRSSRGGGEGLTPADDTGTGRCQYATARRPRSTAARETDGRGARVGDEAKAREQARNSNHRRARSRTTVVGHRDASPGASSSPVSDPSGVIGLAEKVHRRVQLA